MKKKLKTSVMHMTLIFGEMMLRNCLFPYIPKEKALQTFQNEVLEWADEFESSFRPEQDYDLEIREFTIRKLRDRGFLKNDLPKRLPSDSLTKQEVEELVKTKSEFQEESADGVVAAAMDRFGHACVDCCFSVDHERRLSCSCVKSPNFMESVNDRSTCEEWRLQERFLFQ